jgi:hypothetical protein
MRKKDWSESGVFVASRVEKGTPAVNTFDLAATALALCAAIGDSTKETGRCVYVEDSNPRMIKVHPFSAMSGSYADHEKFKSARVELKN